MKNLFVLLVCSCIGLSPFALQAQSSYKYDVEKVVDDVYVLKPAINDLRWVTTSIVVIINDADIFVVDSGLLPSAGEEAIKEIKKLSTKPVKYLLNTHWHGDHWQGNEAFVRNYPAVQIISSREAYKGINRNGMVWVRQFYIKHFSNYIVSYESAVKNGKSEDGKSLSADTLKFISEGLQGMKNDLEELKKLKPVVPTMTFSDQLVITSGKREFQLHYFGWGNTTGDAVLYLPNEKILIPGDLVVYPSPYESGAFSREWFETSKKLSQFDFKHLIPGHGIVQHDRLYLDYLNALFSETIKQLNEAYIQGKNTLDEFQSTVTHASVISELGKNHPDFLPYVKNLDPAFVPAAVRSAFQKAKEGKL
ncbi:MAG TPA: MBL fold metallo-hydrolase [Cyclobacteriaceae bacterium]|nr:MBL fold metallo-hydrolase [Cyclobacteriaceae bacterium]